MTTTLKILRGDCRKLIKEIPDASIQSIVTSPPYWGLRSYLPKNHPLKRFEIGQETTPQEYVRVMVEIFREAKRVLKDDGTVWLNLGDTYVGGGNGGGGSFAMHAVHGADKNEALRRGNRGVSGSLKSKDLVGIPWRVAFALQEDGWYLRSDIIWHKPNPMPESVKDRPTRSHEYIFLLSKSEKYFYDSEAIKEMAIYFGLLNQDESGFKSPESFNGKHKNGYNTSGKKDKQRGHSRRHAGFNERWDAMTVKEQCGGMRNKRDVWTVAPANYKDTHFATFPPKLIEPCILAGSRKGDTVLDIFGGSGVTARVALEWNRNAIVMELNDEYIPMIKKRTIVQPQLV